MGEKSDNVLAGKHNGKETLGEPRHIWEDNKRIHIKGKDVYVLIGFIWFRMEISDGLL
jgi:hypothetical protein